MNFYTEVETGKTYLMLEVSLLTANCLMQYKENRDFFEFIASIGLKFIKVSAATDFLIKERKLSVFESVSFGVLVGQTLKQINEFLDDRVRKIIENGFL